MPGTVAFFSSVGADIGGALGIGAAATTGFAASALTADAVLGAGLGAGLSGIEGGNIGIGALTGGLTGGALGLAGAEATQLGLSPIETGLLDVAAGAGAGAAGAGITGQPIGRGAITGGIEGGLAAALSPSASSPSSSGSATAGGPAAQSGLAGSSGLPDLTVSPASSTMPTSFPGDTTPQFSSGVPADIPNITVATPSTSALGPPATSGFTAGQGIGTGAFQGAIGNDQGTTASRPGDPGQGFGTAPIATSPLGAPSGGLPSNLSGPAFPQSGNLGSTPASGIGSLFTSHPGTVLGAGVLGLEALTQPKLPSESSLVNQLSNQAGTLNAQSQTLESFINNGQLPPGAMAAVNSATAAAKAETRSRYAALGLTGSTSESTALAQIDQNAATQVFDIANNLLQTGIKEAGLSTDIYKSLLTEVNAQNNQMTNAIAAFAASMAGGGNKVTLNVGQG